MILDTSAIVAIVTGEPRAEDLLHKLNQTEARGIGTPTLVESAMVLTGRLRTDAESFLPGFLQEFQITVVAFGEPHWLEASRAFRRFGKGRHPAALNFGDCMSYATARVSGQPLLCTGNDFAKTDLDLV